ncbi:MAG: aminomethyltransferase beta-barrel domain-containing protein [Longibaculum sp.]
MVDIQTKQIVGEHQGIMYYTMDKEKVLILVDLEMHGFCWKEYDENILYVCQGDQNDWLMSEGALITDVNWISSLRPEDDFTCTAKFRYRQKDNDVSVHFVDETTIYVTFKQPIKAVTPGQAAVFYNADVCLVGNN